MKEQIRKLILERNEKLNATFEEKAHIYNIGQQELTSVTRFKHKFFPFDAKEVAKQCAARNKNGKTAKDYLKEWDETAKFGTHIHKLIEDYINGKELNELEKKQITHAIRFIETAGFENIATEIKVYSPVLGLAGTIDWIAIDKKGRLWIIDWKTTKTITETNIYEKANYPLNHLDNAKSIGYAFQTSVYKFILDNEYKLPAKIYGIMIVQLNFNKTVNIFSSENGKLPYLEKEIIQTLFTEDDFYAENLIKSTQN